MDVLAKSFMQGTICYTWVFVITFFLATCVYIWSIFNGVFDIFAILIGYFVVIVISTVIFAYSIKSRREALKTEADRLVALHNPYFAPFGLRWHAPVRFPQCVELWKDYRGQQSGYTLQHPQGGYMGQPMFPTGYPVYNVPNMQYQNLGNQRTGAVGQAQYPQNQGNQRNQGNQGYYQGASGYIPPQQI